MSGEMVLKQLTGFPFKDGVVDFEKYKFWKKRNESEKLCMYDIGTFEIVEVNEEGFIRLHKNGVEDRKVLLKYDYTHAFNVGDKVTCKLKRKTFFIYWEVVEVKKYISSKEGNNAI